jgi:hypothetical protein
MYRFTSSEIDLEELRAHLRKMADADLLRFAKAGEYEVNV